METRTNVALAPTSYRRSRNQIHILTKHMVLKKAVRQYGLEKVGIVTIPCQTMGIRKMQSYPFGVRFLADKIALDIGICCTGELPICIT